MKIARNKSTSYSDAIILCGTCYKRVGLAAYQLGIWSQTLKTSNLLRVRWLRQKGAVSQETQQLDPREIPKSTRFEALKLWESVGLRWVEGPTKPWDPGWHLKIFWHALGTQGSNYLQSFRVWYKSFQRLKMWNAEKLQSNFSKCCFLGALFFHDIPSASIWQNLRTRHWQSKSVHSYLHLCHMDPSSSSSAFWRSFTRRNSPFSWKSFSS